jgi:phenylpyruvate tautomerase PptA (4-oxalocrotonate tautomerase family)
MPLVRISVLRGKSRSDRRAIADNIYEALRESFNVPEEDRFMVITEHDPEDLVFSRSYMGMARRMISC